MGEWREVTLGDVLTLQRGFDITKKQQRPGTVPVVSSSGISSYHDEARAEGPGVVIGRKGSLGTAFYLSGPYWPHDTTLWVKDFKGNDPYYCYLLLKSLRLDELDSGAANPTLNRNHAHQMTVSTPDVAVQRKVASVLRAFDDLIALHERRATTLDVVAHRMYGERSRVSDEVTSTANAESTLRELTTHLSRGISPRYAEDGVWTVINQRCIREGYVSMGPARRQERAVPDVKQLEFGDVLINSTGVGTLGRVGMFLMDDESVTADSHVTIVRPRSPALQLWLGFALRARQGELEAMGTGSTGQTELRRSAVEQLRFRIPSPSALHAFSRAVRPLLDQMMLLRRMQISLSATRDLLLPRLVSGRLDISDLDLGVLTPAPEAA